MKKLSGWLAVAVVGGWLAASALADGVILSWEHMVTIGSPGNSADDTGYGAVAYTYQISAFEVTAGEWCDFLNAVDPTGGNALGLYNASMDSSTYGCQITWNAGSSRYDFSGRPSGSGDDSYWVNRPVNYVSWRDAARYCNWLTTGDTELGVYDTSTWSILDHTTAASVLGVTTAYFIPTEDEWYKAAYYDPGAGVYYTYPTGSDTAPVSEAPPGGSNSANYKGGTVYLLPPYYRNNVGAYIYSASPFGTYDQGGNVWEWNEKIINSSYRGLRGGAFSSYDGYLRADSRYWFIPTNESNVIGFRVASISIVPEPGSLGLLALAGLVGLKRRRRLGR